MLIKQPEGDGDTAGALASDHEVREAAGQAGSDEQRNGCGFGHTRTLQIVETVRKRNLYSLCKDTRRPPLQNVGMIGPKYPNKLAAWREMRGLTQAELADEVGCSAATVGHWETGRSRLTDKWLPRLAEVLKTSAGYILETDPNDVPADVLEVWSDIPEDRRPQALAVLKAFRTGNAR